MAVTYEEIQAWHEAGDDAATIVSKFNAQGVTEHDIDLAALLYTMNFNGMLTKEVGNDAAKKWTGTVLTMKEEVAADASATTSINQWLSHITNQRNSNWQTTRPEYAAPFYSLYQIFNNPPNDAVFNVGDLDAIYALGGGRRETTVTEVQALLDAKATETAQQAREAIVATALQHFAGITATKQAELNTATEHLNNARASLDELAIAGLTDAELQTRADAVVASPDGNI